MPPRRRPLEPRLVSARLLRAVARPRVRRPAAGCDGPRACDLERRSKCSSPLSPCAIEASKTLAAHSCTSENLSRTSAPSRRLRMTTQSRLARTSEGSTTPRVSHQPLRSACGAGSFNEKLLLPVHFKFPAIVQGNGFENVGDSTLVWYGAWPEDSADGVRVAKWQRDRLGYLEANEVPTVRQQPPQPPDVRDKIS